MARFFKANNSFHYPWKILETQLNSDSNHTIRIVGFGSLINVASARRSLPHSPIKAKPVTVMNMMRVYDYLSSTKRRKLPTKPSYQPCALNAYPMEGHHLNGVLLTVTKSTFHAFRRREVGYNLIPCQTVDWYQKDKIIPHTFILSRPRLPQIPFIMAQKGMVPHPIYHDICMSGAEDISQDFALEFLHTTYLADRKTRLSEALCPLFRKTE